MFFFGFNNHLLWMIQANKLWCFLINLSKKKIIIIISKKLGILEYEVIVNSPIIHRHTNFSLKGTLKNVFLCRASSRWNWILFTFTGSYSRGTQYAIHYVKIYIFINSFSNEEKSPTRDISWYHNLNYSYLSHMCLWKRARGFKSLNS